MKKWMIGVGVGVLVVLVFVGININSNRIRKAYIEDLAHAMNLMHDGAATAESFSSLLQEVWSCTIHQESTQRTQVYIWGGSSSGLSGLRPTRDFNVSLGRCLTQNANIVDELEANQGYVETWMLKLQKPPSGMEECYNAIINLYSSYSTMVDLAVNPSGSLLQYSDNRTQTIADFKSGYDRLTIMLPR